MKKNNQFSVLTRTENRKICPELEQVVDTEYRASSSETSIVMKRLSKQRNSTVTIQNVLPPHGSIYANSVLKGVVSHMTYRRMRPDQYRKLACQTDVCNCCLAGQGIRKKLTKLIKGVERKGGYSSVVERSSHPRSLTKTEKLIIGRTPLTISDDTDECEQIEHSKLINSLKNKREKDVLFGGIGGHLAYQRTTETTNVVR